MTFQHEFLQFGKTDDLDVVTIGGRRHYMVDGKPYPSVTTVLNHKPKPEIEAWKERVGHAEAELISYQAAERGKALHAICERYLLNEDTALSNEMPYIVQMFSWIKPLLDQHVTKVYGIELT